MRSEDTVRLACERIREIRDTRAVTVVAIDGAGGAGKSTLAGGIRATVGAAAIIRCDDFYRPLRNDPRAAIDPGYAYENYFEWRRMRDGALMPLRGALRAKYQRRDWTPDRLTDWIEIEPAGVVLVEGVYSSRPELRSLIDLAIFVETPRDERRRRMLVRGHTPDNWIDPWMAAEDWYLDHIDPARNADLVLAGI